MRALLKPVLCFVILCVGFAAPAYGQLYKESVATGLSSEPMHPQTYGMSQMVEMVRRHGQVMIMRLDQELLMFVDNDEKIYCQITSAKFEGKMRAVRSTVETTGEAMHAQTTILPPEQRRLMERILGRHPALGSDTGMWAVKKTGETRMIRGYAYGKLAVAQGDNEVLVLWTTKGVEDFAALCRDNGQVATHIPSITASNIRWGGGSATQVRPEALKVMDGFPTQQEMGRITTVVTKLEKRPTPAWVFEPPAGYTRAEPASVQSWRASMVIAAAPGCRMGCMACSMPRTAALD